MRYTTPGITTWLIAAIVCGAASIPPRALATTFTRVTTDPTRETDPVPSPDGKWLVFSSDRSGSQQVWAMPTAGGPWRQLTFEPESVTVKDPDRPDTVRTVYVRAGTPTWAPDGKSVLFISTRTGRYNIYRVPFEGGKPEPVSSAPGNHRFAATSPDGKRIAFYSNRLEPGSLFGYNIYVMDAAGETPQTLARRLTNSQGSPGHPTWSPDGKWIAYVSKSVDTTKTVTVGEGMQMKQNPLFATYKVWKVPAEGGREVRVSLKPAEGKDFEDTWPTWSPVDPRWIAVTRTTGDKRDVWIIDSNTGRGFKLTNSGNAAKPTWTADGKSIYYTSYDGANEDIWLATNLTLSLPPAAPSRSPGAKSGTTKKTTPRATKGTSGR